MHETDLADLIDGLPAKLTLWHAGPDALPKLLSVVAMRRIYQQATQMGTSTGPAALLPGMLVQDDGLRAREDWLHAVASIVTWSASLLRSEESVIPPEPNHVRGGSRRKGRRRITRQVNPRDFQTALELALRWKELDAIRVGLRTGDMTIDRSQGRHVWLTNHRRAEVEVLDIQLAQVTVLEEPPELEDTSGIDSWFRRHGGRSDLLHSIPEALSTSAWRNALSLLEVQGTSIPETVDIGGLTLADARAAYAAIHGQLNLNEMCSVHLQTEQTLVWGIKPQNLARLLSRRVEPSAAKAFIQMCTFSRGRSPESAPLIPYRDLLLIPSELVSPIAFERTLLRAANANPARVGRLGNTLGDRARRWKVRLETVPGCLVAERVVVKDETGLVLGDLDVVAWDPSDNLAVVFETKWPVDAATLAESNKVDETFAKGRAQLSKLRSALSSGRGSAAWPTGWDLSTTTEFRWWVASAQQLDSTTTAGTDDIGSTSLRLVEHLLPKASLEDLDRAIANVDMPRAGVEFELVQREVEAQGQVLHFEAIGIGTLPVPPPERRLGLGWT